MAAKCGGCGRYLAPADAIKCDKCSSVYHRACVGVSKGTVQSPWHCPECKKNVVRDNQADTPVRGAMQSHMADRNSNNSAPRSPNTIPLDFKEELKRTRNEIMDTLHREFQILRNDIADIRGLVSACNDRMNHLEERVSAIERERVSPSSNSTCDMSATIDQLKRDLNEREQELLTNDLEIAHLPEVSGENPIHTVLLIASKIGVSVEARDVVSAERVGRPGRIDATHSTPDVPRAQRPRHLVVRLARRQLRDELLQAARARRHATTADLELPGPSQRFYINERLTKLNRQLFQLARERGRRLGWQYIWSRRGRILARCKPGDTAFTIRTEADLLRVFGAEAEIKN